MKVHGNILNFVRKKATWIKPQGYNTGINIYNCIAKEKVPLITKQKGILSWYSCGPTVYDDAHIGHASCYLKIDILQRILSRYFNFKIVTAMNITDIDDKIIERAKKLNKPYDEISKFYEDRFWADLRKLKIRKPNAVLKVTENISDMKEFINRLIEKGLAYEKDGSVFFNVKEYSNYGKLVNIKKNDENHDSQSYELPDCVLWKSNKPKEPFWDSPWGDGRPGWHIECSVLASKLFGSSVDIHAGGMDLKFPHHENEEAHSCAYHSSSQWVNYWVHIGQLYCKSSVKMSKSLKNTISVSSLLENTKADEFRLACLLSHYRSRMEYSDELLKMAARVLKKYRAFLNNCEIYCINNKCTISDDESIRYLLLESIENVHEAFCDDFNTPEVINILNRIVKITNPLLSSKNVSVPTVIGLRNFVHQLLELFNIDKSEEQMDRQQDAEVLEILKNFRQNMRKIGVTTRNSEILSLCDEVRTLLKNKGIEISDINEKRMSMN
ncbi:probable cysteine--tRNA ligase, mitochondrial [Coccinella septempunctata]|uniref:probable cysteine--tRNA ligase, mitochondrial n=1 Tax=Coccinella septempunctata TaxID=41139 RepID=UPI001D08305D|nr:probable cysteine--tRNA ligase, mitochondrial [Coccinella septempunctata]